MIEQSFKEAMAQVALHTRDQILADGRLHRFHIEGDSKQSKNGGYVLFNDALPAGSFGSWKTGIKHTWCAKPDQSLTQADRDLVQKRFLQAKKAREQEELERRQATQIKALSIWKASSTAHDDHPYLVKKGVKNYGLRLYKGSLIIPLRDGSGSLHSLQFIDTEGNKRFLSGGRKIGCYFPIGTVADTICICEGYATAASVYEATGHATAVAFDAGNLLSAAKTLRAKFPTIEITLCADNDINTPGNPGLTKAREAAASVGGLIAVSGGSYV